MEPGFTGKNASNFLDRQFRSELNDEEFNKLHTKYIDLRKDAIVHERNVIGPSAIHDME